jgi:hypothetical protein
MYVKLTVGTSPYPLFVQPAGQMAYDFIIQNLSASDIYLLEEATQDSSGAEGIRIVAGGSISKDNWQRNIWLIGTGNNLDVRVIYQSYKPLVVDP